MNMEAIIDGEETQEKIIKDNVAKDDRDAIRANCLLKILLDKKYIAIIVENITTTEGNLAEKTENPWKTKADNSNIK